MASTSPGNVELSKESLPLLDILKSFNNPINEEQAWAVCHQCARYFLQEQNRLKYRELYTHGNRALRVRRDGDIHVEFADKGSDCKGSPARKRNSITGKDIKVVTENDAVQALGLVIYQALDYGLHESEERHLSCDLEALIEFMTNPDGCEDDDEGQNIDDEGIEKDAEDESQNKNCTFQDIVMFCERHLSNDQDAGIHYKAVCRALCAESTELVTFLDKISNNQQRLNNKDDDDLAALDDLQRADWARLWVQIMTQLRRGVRLKKVEHVSLTPTEYELTPFEILLDDIRTRRYTLNKVMVNGDLPPKVKSDAHAVILEFIRSRPPLHSVKKRVLKSPPEKELGPYEKLLHEIKQGHKLRPIKDGKLVVETSRTKLNTDDVFENPLPARKVIKPDYANLLDSFDDDDTDDTSSHCSRRSSVASPSPEKETPAWRRAVMRDVTTLQDRQATLHRRHTIMVCESPEQVSPESPLQNQTIFENEETHNQPEKVSRAGSQHEAASKLKRSTPVSRSHACTSEVRKRLSLKLHGSPDIPVQVLSPVKSHVNACSLHSSNTSSSDSNVSNGVENIRQKSHGRRILVSRSSQPVPVPRSSSAEFRQHPKPLPRSGSATELKPRPRPIQRSSSACVLTRPKSLTQVSDVHPVPRPRERSRSPSPSRISNDNTPESRPKPRPRERSRSPSPNRTVTEETSGPRPRPRPRERSRSPSPDRVNVSSERKSRPIPAPRNIVSPVEGNQSQTVQSTSGSVQPRLRPQVVQRAQSHRMLRHSTDLSNLSAIHERKIDSSDGVSKDSDLNNVSMSEQNSMDNRTSSASPEPQSSSRPMSPSLSELSVQDLLLVSRKVTSLKEEDDVTNRVVSPDPSQDSESESKKWRHPIECLSLNLEEVSHIRMVLTKAELESIINNKDLYTFISKGKVCFTCKTVKFSMFGQWGTKCKICKRNVCNNCLRKMNIPMDHFQNIPVHTLSPIPLSPETLDILKVYESTGSVPHSPNTQRKQQQKLENKSPKRQLQRSHTISSGTQPPMLPNKNVLKGPQMSICCDCKGMIMEIIRTSRSSIALINQRQQVPQRTPRSESSEDNSLKRHSSFSMNIKQFFTSS